MSVDLTIALENRPGTLSELGRALGGAGVNIEGISGWEVAGEGIIHVLVEDPVAARRALEGFEVRAERDVIVLDIEDRPGSFGELAEKVADAGVNVDLCYLATRTRLVLGADNLDKAQAAI
ncbi:MAG TPA: ACT domain-containing protein [Thermoanaerobaculia bacterium]|nr:ACT domain-containing protein [Thermoanaerobaculia bacterium]